MTINRINSIIPPFLKPGDKIEIVSPAKYVSKEEIDYAITVIKSRGFEPILNKGVFLRKNVFAGSVKQRSDNVQSALDNKKSKAIFFSRGGYGCIQIIDLLDFSKFQASPKWLIGFSDITIILNHVYAKYNIQSIHGPMPFSFKQNQKNGVNKIFDLLKKRGGSMLAESNKYNKLGAASGIIIGGNLSILCSLLSSDSFPGEKDYILFIEEVDEYLYHIERMMYSLCRSGVLKRIKGLVVGGMTEIKDNPVPFGKKIHEIIYDIAREYNFPLGFAFPIGHQKVNHPIVIGASAELSVEKNHSKLKYE